jgi:hypothetical protein
MIVTLRTIYTCSVCGRRERSDARCAFPDRWEVFDHDRIICPNCQPAFHQAANRAIARLARVTKPEPESTSVQTRIRRGY